MSLTTYAEGLVVLAVLVACAAAVAWIVVERRFAELTGALRVLALGIVATLALLAQMQLPLMLGVLSRGAAVVTAVLLVAGALLVPRDRRPAGEPVGAAPEPPPNTRVGWAIAIAALVITVAFVAAYVVEPLPHATTHVDYLEF